MLARQSKSRSIRTFRWQSFRSQIQVHLVVWGSVYTVFSGHLRGPWIQVSFWTVGAPAGGRVGGPHYTAGQYGYDPTPCLIKSETFRPHVRLPPPQRKNVYIFPLLYVKGTIDKTKKLYRWHSRYFCFVYIIKLLYTSRCCCYWTRIHVRYMLSPVRPSVVSVVCLSVCNVRAPRLKFSAMFLCHFGHPCTRPVDTVANMIPVYRERVRGRQFTLLVNTAREYGPCSRVMSTGTREHGP